MQRIEFGSNFCEEIQISNQVLKDSEKEIFFDSGRSALRYLLKQLGEASCNVMLPQYTCESVIEPFLEHGCNIAYYPVDKRFEIPKEKFSEIVKNFCPQLVLVQTYFGTDTLRNMRRNFEQLRNQGIWVVEDITHAVFSGWKGRGADFTVGSLRKWCSIPDGGVLAAVTPKAKELLRHEELQENIEFVQMRIQAQKEKRKYFQSRDDDNWDEKKKFIEWFDASEKMLDMQRECFSMSGYTRERINSIDREALKKRRQKNYSQLRKALKRIPEIEVVESEIGSLDVPLYCPFYIKGEWRDELRAEMRKKNIMLPIIWPKPDNLSIELDSKVLWIYEHILIIPCDQRYDADEIEVVIQKLEQSVRRYSECIWKGQR